VGSGKDVGEEWGVSRAVAGRVLMGVRMRILEYVGCSEWAVCRHDRILDKKEFGGVACPGGPAKTFDHGMATFDPLASEPLALRL